MPRPVDADEYVAKGGTECPFCRCGGNLHTGEFSGPDGNATAYLNVKCLDCGKEWTDVYTLSSITPLEDGD
jgi:C4-type Zn-finger protein